MSNFQRLSRCEFPVYDLPNTAEEYYVRVRNFLWNTKKEVLNSRETLIAALDSDEELASFWKSYRETGPDAEKYLSSLIDATQPFDKREISIHYDRFLRWQKFSDISSSAREKIQSAFNAIRPTLYQGFLEEEAVRLNCDVSEVRPKVPVLPLKEGGQSELCFLPDDVFAKIMDHLETMEIFQLTQVCKKWRRIIYRNASTLTRAEYSLTTHLLTFTYWMNQSNVVKGREFRKWYTKSAWSLMRWCCNISQNLETLILHDIDRPLEEVISLLRQCPNLKHLHFDFRGIDKRRKTDLHLPELESLIVEELVPPARPTKTVVDVFKKSRCLRVFKGKLTIGDIALVNPEGRKQNAFANLTALELVEASLGLLATLDTLDQLPLRYLCLGDCTKLFQIRLFYYSDKIRAEKDAFHRLLSKLNQLEVLVSLYDLNLDANTIKLMTRRQRSLKSALVQCNISSLENEEDLESTDGRYHSDVQVALVSFEEMLLERDPSTNLSAFKFLVHDEKSLSFLQDAKTGFSFYQSSDMQSCELSMWSLSHPAMRRRLGIDF